MNLIFTLLLLSGLESLAVAGPVSFQPYTSHKRGGSIVAVGDFADIRVLDPARTHLAYWMVKKGTLKIEQFFNAVKVTEVRIEKIDGKFQTEINYNLSNGKLALVRAKRTLLRRMAGTLVDSKYSDSICKLHNDLFENLKAVATNVSVDTCEQNLDTSIIDSSCKTVFPPAEFKALKNAYVANLIVPEEENQVSSCLKRPETARTLAAAYKISEPSTLQTQIEIIDYKFKLDTLGFYNPANAATKKITCAYGKQPGISAITEPNGVTTYYRNKDAPESKSSGAFERLVMHELLHSSGVINENTTRDLVSICFDNATKISGDASVNKFDISSLKTDDSKGDRGYTRTESATVAQHQFADTAAPKITNEIALTAVPDTVPASDFAPAPAALAQTVIDSGSPAAAASPDYPETYARVAMQQGASAIRSAQGLLSAARAVALPMAFAGSTGGRTPAAVSKPSIYIPTTSAGSYSASASAATGGGTTSASDLDAASVAAASQDLPTGIARKSLKASRSVASAEVGSRSQNESGGAITSSGSVGGVQGSGGSDGSSSSGSSAGGSYTPSQRSHGKRRAASVDPKEQQSILQLLNRPESYRITKKKLEDADFVQKLKNNGIAIFRNDGSVKGDPSGSIKYSDKGNRFVRED